MHLDAVDLCTLSALIEHMPQGSALLRALYGPDADLTYADHLLRMVVSELRVANWQRAGDKHARRPTPPDTPGELEKAAKGKTYNQTLVKKLRAKHKRKGTADGKR